jgi:Arc/MetJ-type ribon-helix-helix transcriptional regulator
MSDGLTKERKVAINIEGEVFNVNIPLGIIELIDQLVREQKYESRSHVMRLGMKKILESEGLLNNLPRFNELDDYTASKITRSARDFLPSNGDDRY